METKQFAKGEVIFAEGSPGHSLYEVLSGSVGIYVASGSAAEKKLTELGPGGVFGEVALLEAVPRSASAIAGESGAEVKEIREEEFLACLSEDPGRILKVMCRIGEWIRMRTDDYEEACTVISEFLSVTEGAEEKESLAKRIIKLAAAYRLGHKGWEAKPLRLRELPKKEAGDGSIQAYRAGTVIFREGDASSCMYAVHWGKVGIFTALGTPEEKKLTEIMPNQFFGEMGMIENVPRSASAVVLEDDTTVETITSGDLEVLFRRNPAEIDMILEHLSHRLRQLTADYVDACGVVSALAEAREKQIPAPEEVLKKAKQLSVGPAR